MAWSEAISSVASAFSQVFRWAFGGQTRQERRLEAEAEALEKEWHDTSDPRCLDRLNDIRARLKRLRDQAAARRL